MLVHCLFAPQMFTVEHSLISDDGGIFDIHNNTAFTVIYLGIPYLDNFHLLTDDNQLYTDMSNFL